MTTGQIITVRHGEPAMDRTVRITAREYGEWWAGYNRAGLVPGQVPSQELKDAVAQADVVLSSTLPRAIETAATLVDGARAVPADDIYVEASLPPPPIPFLKMTPTHWGFVSRTIWYVGYAPGDAESHFAARRRVKALAQRLIEHTEQGKTVVLCAHGYLNWMIDSHLKTIGWSKIAHKGKNNYWSWRTYQRAVPATAE